MNWKISKIHESQREQLVPEQRRTWVPISPLTFSILATTSANICGMSTVYQHRTEDLHGIISCNSHAKSVMKILLSPFCRGRNKGSERMSDLLKGTQLVKESQDLNAQHM